MSDKSVTFFGETFAVPDRIAATAVMRFAKAAKAEVDSKSFEGMVAQYDLLQQAIAPEDWVRFEALADSERASGEELWDVISQVFVLLADRPTVRSSDSSDGPQTTEPSSLSEPAQEADLLFPGRPDLAVVPLRMQTA